MYVDAPSPALSAVAPAVPDQIGVAAAIFVKRWQASVDLPEAPRVEVDDEDEQADD
jgi:hypothetical protein